MNEDTDLLAETENFAVWTSDDNSEKIYHLELGGISLHLLTDEWEELLLLFKSI